MGCLRHVRHQDARRAFAQPRRAPGAARNADRRSLPGRRRAGGALAAGRSRATAFPQELGAVASGRRRHRARAARSRGRAGADVSRRRRRSDGARSGGPLLRHRSVGGRPAPHGANDRAGLERRSPGVQSGHRSGAPATARIRSAAFERRFPGGGASHSRRVAFGRLHWLFGSARRGRAPKRITRETGPGGCSKTKPA